MPGEVLGREDRAWVSGADGRTSLLTGQRLPRHQDVSGGVRRLRNVIVPDGGAEGAVAGVARRKSRRGLRWKRRKRWRESAWKCNKVRFNMALPGVAKIGEKMSRRGTERSAESGKSLMFLVFNCWPRNTWINEREKKNLVYTCKEPFRITSLLPVSCACDSHLRHRPAAPLLFFTVRLNIDLLIEFMSRPHKRLDESAHKY